MELPFLNFYLCTKPLFTLYWSMVLRCGTLRFQLSSFVRWVERLQKRSFRIFYPENQWWSIGIIRMLLLEWTSLLYKKLLKKYASQHPVWTILSQKYEQDLVHIVKFGAITKLLLCQDVELTKHFKQSILTNLTELSSNSIIIL